MMSDGDKVTPGLLNDQEEEIEEILTNVNNTTLGGDDWNVVVMETKSLSAKWEEISICLGLSFDLIDGTKRASAGDCYRCWSEALKQWIKQNYNTKKFGEPSWRTLLKAIAGVDKRKSRKLAADHQKKVEQPQSENSTEGLQTTTTNDQAKEPISFADSGLSETVSIKPCLTFPFLKLENASKAEEARIHQRLFTESEGMVNKFKDLFKTTRESLLKRTVLVKELLKHLDCLGSIQPTFKDSTLPVLGCQLPELRKSKNVDDAMSVISSYCSFFNYHIVEEIINNLGTEQDKTNLKNYQEEFSVYAQRHIFECPSELGEISETSHANMFVTLDATYESYTVSHLYAFVSNLQRVLKVPAVSLRLCRIGPGSLKMIFQLPHSVQRAIFPLSSEQEEALTDLGVVQLSCGEYQFTRQENEDIKDPATDGDSDHTDSEDNVASKNTCNAELASLDAGLAVAKPEDGFSVTDSALGRSSVVSVTTAGVTQFSEDLFDREMADLDIGMDHLAMESGHSDKNELQLASRRGDLEEVKRLIEEKQFNPFEKVGKYGMNALHYAAWGGQLGVMKYYTEERGYNPATQTSDGWTCLHYAAVYNHFDLVQYLVDEQKMDPMCQTKLGTTPLHLACVGGDISVVAYLVNAMSQYLPMEEVVRCKDQYGWSPVHVAAFFGKLEIIKQLITEFNSDPLMTDDSGRIALHNAAYQGHLHTVKFLVELKCNASHTDNKKVTPLHLAAWKGRLEVVKYLTLEQHCDPLCTNNLNNTPLHSAAKRGKLKVVKFFIESLHCSPDVRGQRNMTPLKWARRKGRHQVVKYLESIRHDSYNN